MAFRQTIYLPSGTGFNAVVIAANTNTGLPRKVRIFEISAWSSATRTSLELVPNSTSGDRSVIVQVSDVEKSNSYHEGFLLPNGCYAITGANYAGGAVTFDVEL